MTDRTAVLLLLVASCARAPEPIQATEAGVNQYGQALPASSTPIYATGFKPAPPQHPGHPGDLQDLACQHAKSLGCSVSDSCAYELRQKGDDRLWLMRVQTVIEAKTRKHVDDSTVLPCDDGDAGRDR
jgi:hypothetical protein